MTDRYFVEVPIEGPQARLLGNEAHHLAHVMRAGPGDVVVLFDGSGAEFSARVETVGRAEIELAVLDRREVSRELPWPLTVGVALPKGDRQRWLVEKATELGVTCLVPQLSRHSSRAPWRFVVGALAAHRDRSVETVRSQPTDGDCAVSAAARLSRCGSARGAALIAQPGESQLTAVLDDNCGASGSRTVIVAVGPEGGFAAAELEAAAAFGWQAVGLGPRILRIETAVVALVAAVIEHA